MDRKQPRALRLSLVPSPHAAAGSARRERHQVDTHDDLERSTRPSRPALRSSVLYHRLLLLSFPLISSRSLPPFLLFATSFRTALAVRSTPGAGVRPVSCRGREGHPQLRGVAVGGAREAQGARRTGWGERTLSLVSQARDLMDGWILGGRQGPGKVDLTRVDPAKS